MRTARSSSSTSRRGWWYTPATDEVRIRFTGGAPQTIELMDATGRRVSTERYRTDGAISVNALSEGLYVVRALDTDGRTLAQQRLIVQR